MLRRTKKRGKYWNDNLKKLCETSPKLISGHYISVEEKNISGNKIKRCWLNNVLRRFDKEGQRNNRHRRFHRLLSPTMRKILLVHVKNPVDAHCHRGKCYKHHEIAGSHDHRASPRTQAKPSLSFHQHKQSKSTESSRGTEIFCKHKSQTQTIAVFLTCIMQFSSFCTATWIFFQEFL